MPKCRKCGYIFPNRIRIGGKSHNVGSRRFCLNCSPFGKHNTTDLSEPTPDQLEFKTCSSCGKKKSYIDFYPRGHRKSRCSRCKSCLNQKTAESQRRRKKQYIEYKGGRCVICGYNKCIGALHFHHLDSSQKDFKISRFPNCSLETVRKELDKCILVCANCHAEVHSNVVIVIV